MESAVTSILFWLNCQKSKSLQAHISSADFLWSIDGLPRHYRSDRRFQLAVENVPDLPGKTFIMVDASGSMTSTVSERSQMTYMDAGYALSAILAKKGGRKTTIACFGTRLKEVPFSAADSVMNIIHKMEKAGHEVDWSTNAYLALYWLLGRKPGNIRSGWGDRGSIMSQIPEAPVKVDRVVVVSDMACYGEDNLGALLSEYRQKVNRDVKYYSVNMAGYDQSQADPKDKNTLLISGWSESIFTVMREFEGLQEASKGKDAKEIPSIDLLRERFQVL